MRRIVVVLFVLWSFQGQAQVCDPGIAPTGLISTYTPGSGALLQWDAVPGSIGIQIKATSPSGSNVTRRILGFERDQFLVPDALLTPGTYTWQVQAACSTIPPFSTTPVSGSDAFTVGGGGTCPAALTDIDGNVYTTLQIGSQCWMAENLKVERYRNGDNISTSLSNASWETTTSGAFAVYNNSAAKKAVFGLLYNWFAVADSRGLCPGGWHVPADEEWTLLTDFLGGSGVAGGKMKTIGTISAGTGLWQDPNTGATNSSEFSAIPGGSRFANGNYFDRGGYGYFWSSSESSSIVAWSRILTDFSGEAFRTANTKQFGFSVRCLKD
jgi:uncharacterized protein (TIGR02145 family)